jgi:hypothetical protein
MTLTVLDRLLLLNLLPAEGDLTTLRIVRTLRESLSFTEDEHAAFHFKQDGAQVTWDAATETEKDIEIKPKALALIVSELQRLSAEKKLTAQTLPLYERFVPDE